MPTIVLSTLNARYPHSAFGLRYLLANMGDLRQHTVLQEFTINQPLVEIADRLLELSPEILGLGVYIWNVEQTTQLCRLLRRLLPETVLILGGPEVSHELQGNPLLQLADHVITGEADRAFADVCRSYLTRCSSASSSAETTLPIVEHRSPLPTTWVGDAEPNASPSTADRSIPSEDLRNVTVAQVTRAELPDLTQMASPYNEYTQTDLQHRVLYVEASRGCPFRCQFCLSALPDPVRQFPLPQFLQDMQSLMDRGARQFKFVDRTFNLNVTVGTTILNFFLDRYQPGMFLHFEMIPDRLPDALRSLIARFPPGVLQFEIGIQTWNPEVAARIDRRQDYATVRDNLTFLRQHTGVHIHADLIVGLPGETVESFASGLNELVALKPHEIQIGLLKRLKGTPIAVHDQSYEMLYSPVAPYELLSNSTMDARTVASLRRFARYWDIYFNSGRFPSTLEWLWRSDTVFNAFDSFSRWLFHETGRTYGLALTRQFELLFDYLREQTNDEQALAESLWSDYCRIGRSDRPRFLKDYRLPSPPSRRSDRTELPQRQRQHLKDAARQDQHDG